MTSAVPKQNIACKNVDRMKSTTRVSFSKEDLVNFDEYDPDEPTRSIHEPGFVAEEYDEKAWYEEEYVEDIWKELSDLEEDDDLTRICKDVIGDDSHERIERINKIQCNVLMFALKLRNKALSNMTYRNDISINIYGAKCRAQRMKNKNRLQKEKQQQKEDHKRNMLRLSDCNENAFGFTANEIISVTQHSEKKLERRGLSAYNIENSCQYSQMIHSEVTLNEMIEQDSIEKLPYSDISTPVLSTRVNQTQGSIPKYISTNSGPEHRAKLRLSKYQIGYAKNRIDFVKKRESTSKQKKVASITAIFENNCSKDKTGQQRDQHLQSYAANGGFDSLNMHEVADIKCSEQFYVVLNMWKLMAQNSHE